MLWVHSSYSYDPAGRLHRESTDILARTYHYDARDNLLRSEDTAGGLSVCTYSEADERMTATAYRDGIPRTAGFTYDGAGAVESVEYADGHLVRYAYDAGGRLTGEVHYAPTPAERLTASGLLVEILHLSWSYDEFGDLESSTDGEGGTTGYAYDYLGHPKSQTDPTGVALHYTYDGAGRLLETRDSAGLVTRSRSKWLVRGLRVC